LCFAKNSHVFYMIQCFPQSLNFSFFHLPDYLETAKQF
jgi:hypothetical protein